MIGSVQLAAGRIARRTMSAAAAIRSTAAESPNRKSLILSISTTEAVIQTVRLRTAVFLESWFMSTCIVATEYLLEISVRTDTKHPAPETR